MDDRAAAPQYLYARIAALGIAVLFTLGLFLLVWQVLYAPTKPEPLSTEAQIIQALFLGTGPLYPARPSQRCWYQKRWIGFPRGTTVKVRVSTTVPVSIRNAIREALQQVPGATLGALDTAFELTSDPNPIPDHHEVTVTGHPDPVSQDCTFPKGCTIPIRDLNDWRLLHSSRVVMPPTGPMRSYIRDVIGHGVLSLCHIDGNLIGGAENSLMSAGKDVYSNQIAPRLTELDIKAITAVYGSRLQPGARHSAFARVLLRYDGVR